MLAVCKREWKSYFTSMLGYVYLTLFLILGALMFFLNNLQGGTASMTGFFGGMISWSIFILPILTMRLFAEERRQKTEQLLLTAPVDIWEIVCGKFLAAVSAYAVGVAVTIVYAVLLAINGSLPIAETISIYIGYLLFCACIISIGTFVSSVTESQVIAAIVTYAVMLVTMFLGNLSQLVPNEILSKALMWISPLDRFSDFTAGVLNAGAVIYYISIIVIFLFLTTRVLEKRRWS
jgi:ABC-2 type transport system permease protein